MTTAPPPTDRPGGYSIMIMVGPRALARLLEPDGYGPLSLKADLIAAGVVNAAGRDELVELIDAAVDILARYTLDDLLQPTT